jgi:hypothetical protein
MDQPSEEATGVVARNCVMEWRQARKEISQRQETRTFPLLFKLPERPGR